MTGVHTLDGISHQAPAIQGVWVDDVQAGDWVVVRTKNSVYSLAVLGGGRFQVAGSPRNRPNPSRSAFKAVHGAGTRF